MSDRELLELAAKAAGISGNYLENVTCGMLEINRTGIHSGSKWWNPLLDDGDALRLAVNLGMLLDVEGEHRGYIQAQARDGTFAHYEDKYTDPYAATRRAIVRAAAEIGKGMK